MEINIPFDLLFEQSTLATIIVDKDGGIIMANPFALNLFGYQLDELRQQKIEILIPQKYRQNHVKYREKFEESPQNRPIGNNQILYAQKKDGTNFPVEICISKSPETNLTIAFVIDISSRIAYQEVIELQIHENKKNNLAIQKLNNELEQKIVDRTRMLKEALTQLEASKKDLETALEQEKELSDLKSRFVSMASHEFKTPLSTILSSVSLIEKYNELATIEKQQKHISRIKSTVKNLSNILDEFLSLGRLDEGKIKCVFNEFNIVSLVNDTLNEIHLLQKNNQTISYQHDGDATVFSDENILRNCLINILSNAVKYSGDNAAISIISRLTSQNLKIVIADNGIGIAEQDLKHISERFFRGKNATHIAGTGLGLNIVQKYMDELNGSFQIESKENVGTTVTLTLPVQ